MDEIQWHKIFSYWIYVWCVIYIILSWFLKIPKFFNPYLIAVLSLIFQIVLVLYIFLVPKTTDCINSVIVNVAILIIKIILVLMMSERCFEVRFAILLFAIYNVYLFSIDTDVFEIYNTIVEKARNCNSRGLPMYALVEFLHSYGILVK
jgi:hypothetical protein